MMSVGTHRQHTRGTCGSAPLRATASWRSLLPLSAPRMRCMPCFLPQRTCLGATSAWPLTRAFSAVLAHHRSRLRCPLALVAAAGLAAAGTPHELQKKLGSVFFLFFCSRTLPWRTAFQRSNHRELRATGCRARHGVAVEDGCPARARRAPVLPEAVRLDSD